MMLSRMDRRSFSRLLVLGAGSGMLPSSGEAGRKSELAPVELPKWRPGMFQIHFIYTGVAESMFLIFPDSTTMLLDCGDHDAIERGALAVQVLPDGKRRAGEWIARYVRRVNPNGDEVDYMVASHMHLDHTGCRRFHAGRVDWSGGTYFLSGFAQAAQALHFRRAIDRGWPDYTDPVPYWWGSSCGAAENMVNLYAHLAKRDGLAVEKFRLGVDDQIVPLRGGAGDFRCRNVCANGKVADVGGQVRDVFAGRNGKLKECHENGMSLGMVFTVGKFKLFTAGDFSSHWNLPGGGVFEIEDVLADAVERVDVAKLNHHACPWSSPTRLLKALDARVFVSCVWDQLHNDAETLSRIANQSILPGRRMIVTGIFPAERMMVDAGRAFMPLLMRESWRGAHVVVTVEPGGTRYTVARVSASDERMSVIDMCEFARD